MLRKSVYPKIEATLNRMAAYLHKRGFTPNQLTLAGLGVTFIAGCFYAAGQWALAGLILIAASFADLLDGSLARISDRVTPFGAFLDSTVDRYCDFFLFGGLALFFARNNQGGWFLICLGILLGSYITSYTKARAENFLDSCRVGVFERAERIIALILASLIPPIMPVVLWVLLFGTHFTAIQRILHTHKVLSEKPSESSDST